MMSIKFSIKMAGKKRKGQMCYFGNHYYDCERIINEMCEHFKTDVKQVIETSETEAQAKLVFQIKKSLQHDGWIDFEGEVLRNFDYCIEFEEST